MTRVEEKRRGEEKEEDEMGLFFFMCVSL